MNILPQELIETIVGKLPVDDQISLARTSYDHLISTVRAMANEILEKKENAYPFEASPEDLGKAVDFILKGFKSSMLTVEDLLLLQRVMNVSTQISENATKNNKELSDALRDITKSCV